MTAPLESNLAALAARDPSLAQRVGTAAESPSADIRIEFLPSGLFHANALAPDGSRIALDSRYDPKKEAARTIESAGIKRSAGVLAFGFGMGYHLLEISERIGPDGFLAVVEADEKMLAAALKHVDFSSLLSRENFRLFCGKKVEGIAEWLNGFVTEMILRETNLFEHQPSLRLHPEEYGQAKGIVHGTLGCAHSELTTKIDHAGKFFVNTWRNLPAILESPGVEALFGGFKGRAAFTVAAGPSLDKNIAGLARAPRSALIICVGTALKVLLEHGIVPHIVVAVDPQEKSARYFDCVEGKPLRPSSALVCTTSVFPAVPRKFAGMNFFAWEDNGLCNFFRRFTGDRMSIAPGLSVAHAAFQVAREAGCNPIVMLGQDLAFSDGRTHASGVERTWGGRIDENDPRCLRLPAVGGGTVASLPVFRSFLVMFEGQIARTEARVINATTGGALIRGAEHMPLDDAISCCPSGDSDSREVIRQAYDSHGKQQPGQATSALVDVCGQLRAGVERLRKTALKAVELAEGKPAGVKVAELNRLLAGIVEDREVMPLLEDVMIETYFTLKKRTDSAPTQDRQVRRAAILAQGTAKAAAILVDCIDECCKQRARVNGL